MYLNSICSVSTITANAQPVKLGFVNTDRLLLDSNGNRVIGYSIWINRTGQIRLKRWIGEIKQMERDFEIRKLTT